MPTAIKQFSDSEIRRYLFAEMSDEEQTAFEGTLFDDDEFFFDVTATEDKLVDEYVSGRMAAADVSRFEQSLVKVPARRTKVANARPLLDLAADERPLERMVGETQNVSIWQSLSAMVGFRSPAFGLAAMALFVLLGGMSVFLVVKNRQQQAEVASLQNSAERIEQLEREAANSRQHETELQNAIDAERDASGDYAEELESERTRRATLEREIQQIKNRPVEKPQAQIVATIALSPLGGRGKASGLIAKLELPDATRRVSFKLPLPDEITSTSRLSVKVNGKTMASGLTPRVAGAKVSLLTTIPATSLTVGRNRIDVFDASGEGVESYELEVIKK